MIHVLASKKTRCDRCTKAGAHLGWFEMTELEAGDPVANMKASSVCRRWSGI